LTAQRNGGTRQRNAFQPLLFAPARRGKFHYFRNTALRYSSAVRLPLLFPKKSFGFFGDPIFPLHKGTKALHRKNGGSDSRPPSFRPTAVFILHLPPGYFWLDLAGWDYNPSVTFGDTSLCTREAALRVTCESLFRQPSADTFPSGKADYLGGKRKEESPRLLRRHPPLTRGAIASVEGGGRLLRSPEEFAQTDYQQKEGKSCPEKVFFNTPGNKRTQ